MTVHDTATPATPVPRDAPVAPTSPIAPSTSLREPEAAPLASSRRRSRIMRYFAERGWVHLLLLTGIALFLFPFAYMFATSLKTDEELTESGWFPSIPEFQATSPRVRSAPVVAK